MFIFLFIVVVLVLAGFIVMNQRKFGKHPAGTRLERIKTQSNYSNGAFQNQSFTPDLTEGASFYSVGKEFLFSKKERMFPKGEIPSEKTDLLHLDPANDILVWFGHSSYFIQVDGKTILVDPVLSGYASPFSFTTNAFKGADIYKPEDIPEIDILFITHDHWDHLDYNAVMQLRAKIKQIICSLGTGEHLEFWGFDKNIITEMNWNETMDLGQGFVVNTVPARHFSGRTFKRNQGIWTSYALRTPTLNLYLGGDSGYDKHFAEAGNNFGPFDLALLENGQYDKNWKYIHMLPEETLKAANDLKAKRLFPVHNSKFKLGNHEWDTPMREISRLKKAMGVTVITPKIGQQVNLKDTTQQFEEWWNGVE